MALQSPFRGGARGTSLEQDVAPGVHSRSSCWRVDMCGSALPNGKIESSLVNYI